MTTMTPKQLAEMQATIRQTLIDRRDAISRELLEIEAALTSTHPARRGRPPKSAEPAQAA